MQKINSKNIANYISYLHQWKLQQAAPTDLINSWAQLNDAEIPEHLNNLYKMWNIDYSTIDQLNDDFFRKTAYVPTPSTGNNPKNSSKQILQYVIIGLLLIVVVFLAKMLFFNKPSIETTQANVAKETAPTPAPEVQQQQPVVNTATQPSKPANKDLTENLPQNIKNSASESSDEINDEINVSKIRTLLVAETNQDISTIKNLFASNGVRYWDMKNVTNSQVAQKYLSVWNKSSDFSYEIEAAKKINKNKYLVTGYYSYYSATKGNKTVYFKNVYIFNNNNKIIAAYSY